MATLIRGGRVIDPAADVDGVADVLVDGDRIVSVGRDLAGPLPDADVIDARGMVVTPGLIDLHVHVVPGLGDFCLPPDQVGVESAVTTVIDAGTSGVATFGLVRRAFDDPDVRTRILALMDPNQIYFATKDFICHRLEIANDVRNLDVESAMAAVEANSDIVVGLKVRACHTGDPTVSPFLEGAKRAAGRRPVMVHLGRFPHTPTIATPTLLDALRSGDVITHAFRGASGVLGDDGKVTPELAAAVDRGIRLDVGHSGTDFRFRAARALFEQGHLPTTISTDLNVFNVDHPVVSLAETMTKVWALDVPLADVVAMVTTNPADVVGRADQLGSLAAGREADVSILRVEGPRDDGDRVVLSDGYEDLVAERRLVPHGCLRAGTWIPSTRGQHRATAS